MLELADKWIWDSWYVFDGQQHHAFYLHASKSLGNPDRRHRHPIIGHAVSDDLTNWTVVRDALIVSDEPEAFDSWTTWTGSVVRDDAGLWWMFYTGTSRSDGGDVQTVGAATSKDLLVWEKVSSQPLVSADPTWYEKLNQPEWHDEAWRDPWVFRFPKGVTTGAAAVGVPEGSDASEVWHMLVTARAKEGAPVRELGVMGHATSTNLRDWTVQPPLSKPNQGFGQLEVYQFEVVDGVPVVFFCCGWRELGPERLAAFGKRDATYSMAVNPDLSDLDFSKAVAFENRLVYAGRLVQGKTGEWFVIGFDNFDAAGEFVGRLCDPIPVTAVAGRGIVAKADL
ncbi:MAG: glycosyl hydrolase family 32 [Micrococcales bacterium]